MKKTLSFCWFGLLTALGVLGIIAIIKQPYPVKRPKPSAPATMSAPSTPSSESPGTSPGPAAGESNLPEDKTGAPQERPPVVENSLPRFKDWLMLYSQETAPAAKAQLEVQGLALAQQRLEEMARLIEQDPERALQEAIPFAQRQQLPDSIKQHLEQPISGRGDLRVMGVLPEEGDAAAPKPGIVRTATLNGQTYSAYVYGRRLSQTTKQNIPLHGIAIGKTVAVHESPVRELDPVEAAARASEIAPENAKCPVSGQQVSVEDAAAVVDVGGEIRILCNGGHIEVLKGNLIAAEGASLSGTGDLAASLNGWSQGPKTLLYIRVRFSDQTNDPQSLLDSQTMFTNIDNFFVEGSYDTTFITPTFTPVYVLSNSTAYYISNDIYALRTDALNLAKANGYDYVNWDLDAVRYTDGPGAFSGAAYVGARGCWLKSSSAGVASHEFGHNYGLWHANSWNPSDESPIGPGTWQEYGDSFDTMGAAGAGIYHYNPRYKSVLNWIATDGIMTASTNGVYRVYAHDFITSSNQIRGLSVRRDGSKNYWIDFRQKWTGNIWLMNGAGLRRADTANNNNPGSELLDTTPNSPDGKTDSALLIGRTFSDISAGVHITPIGKGGTSPESLDVVVNYGPFPSNSAPTLAISASATSVPVGTPVTFTATASDPNGDTLAYSWDFDDKTYGFNTPNPSKSWSSTGERVVRCVVSDMKGGTASRWIVITVGSPTTFRITGRLTDGTGAPMENVRVHNGLTSGSYRGCFTDSDGNYTIVNLGTGSYTLGAAAYGFACVASGFTNPVAVGPSKSGINFVGTAKTYSIAGRITDGGVAVANAQVSDGVRLATSNTNGDYTITSVPNGSYTLTATKSGYTLNPNGWANPITVADANLVSRDFVTPTYTISGEITGTANSVTITDGYRNTTSYKQGSGQNAKNVFSLSGVPAGTWNLRAMLTGSSFSPSGFSNPLTVTGNSSGRNFALDATPTFCVAGTITYNGSGLAGATVTAGSRSSLTDSRGGYCIIGLTNGTYNLVPSLTGYGFTPSGSPVTIASANATGPNFTAVQTVAPTVTLTASDADASEPGSNTGSFTVSRSGSTVTAITVFYSVSGTATAGSDYAALSGSVTIPAGTNTAVITVSPLDDTNSECPETVIATLVTNANYVLGFPISGTATITDNDLSQVSIVALDSALWENSGASATFSVIRSGCLTSALTVNYSAGGTASAGSDYQTLSGSVTIPAGAASTNITVAVLDDLLADGDKTLTIAISSSASYNIGAPASASVALLDNESNHAPQANAGLDQSVSILGLASLNGSATDDGLPGTGLTYAWSKMSGPGTVLAADPSAKNTTACFSMPGSYVLRLTVSDGQLSASDDVTVTVTASDPTKVLNALNAGGPQYTAGAIFYRADTWFAAGSTNSSTSTIAATADGVLYQTERAGDFDYNIPVSGGNQTYLVVLKFAETLASGPGQRLFDVLVDGNLALDNLDLYTQAGPNTAFDIVMPVSSSNAMLNIQFRTQTGSILPAKVSAILIGSTQALSPAAPANFTATATSSTQIQLSWTDNSANETNFQLEVSTDSVNYAPVASLGANVTTYTHTGLSGSTTYYYRLRSCNSAGCSSDVLANAATLAGPPAAPSNLTLTAVSSTQINLAWTDNSANETGFTIERSLNGTSFTVIATLGPNATTYPATGLARNTRYYFRVRSFNNLGSSTYSNTANTKTKSR